MATTNKPGILSKVKAAVSGMFSKEPARKSPERVEAGKKAATTAKVDSAVKSTESAVKKVAKKAGASAKKRSARKSR